MYDYLAAREGKGAAAPPAPSASDYDDLLLATTSASGGGAAAAVAAYKKENEKLKELLQLKDEGGSGDVLEGKYLTQLKQNRTLTVQLETERDKAKALQGRVTALEAAAESNATSKGGKAKRAATNANANNNSNNNPKRDIFAPEVEADDADTTAAELVAARQQLTRAQQLVRERDVALEEQKREVARLKDCLTREVGAAEIGKVLSNNMNNNSWKGRAEQLSLLKVKTKELEKNLSESEGNAAQLREQFLAFLQEQNDKNNTNVNTSGGGGDDLESLMALVRRTENSSNTIHTNDGTTPFSRLEGTMTTTSSAHNNNVKKDVDEDAKDHLSQLRMKNRMAQHDLEKQLENAKSEILNERKKQTALQARFQILQDSNSQLKENITLLIDKSQSDDELVEVYKQELDEAKAALAAATAELTSLREEAWGAESGAATSTYHNKRGGGGGGGGSAPPSASGGAVPGRRSSATATKPNSYTHQMKLLSEVEDTPVQELSEWVYQTLLQHKQSGAPLTKQSINPYVVPLLQTAHSYVVETNRENKQLFFASTALYDMYNRLIQSALNYLQQQQKTPSTSSKKENNNNNNNNNNNGSNNNSNANSNAIMALVSQIMELPPIENYLLNENSSLKKRVQSLTELMECEQRAYTTLAQQQQNNNNNNNSAAAAGSTKTSGEGEGEDYVTKYNELHKQYVELRKAFNSMKQKEMNGQL